jgi:hypothetical protein
MQSLWFIIIYGCVSVLPARNVGFFIYMLVESSVHTLALLYVTMRTTNVYTKDSRVVYI